MKSKIASLVLACCLVACGAGTLNTVRSVWDVAKKITDCLLSTEYTDKESAFLGCGVTPENVELAESTWQKMGTRDQKKVALGRAEGERLAASKVGTCTKK